MKKVILSMLSMMLALLTVGCSLVPNAISYTKEYFPQDGVWFCEELQMQLAFDGTMNSCVMNESKIIPCTWVIEPGSSYIDVCKQKGKSHYSYPGETIFSATIIQSDNRLFIVSEDNTDTEYTFYKISSNEKINVEEYVWKTGDGSVS